MSRPPTIHDFYGFPKALHEVEYSAPGDPALARDIIELLAPLPVQADTSWGLDHGTRSVLLHMYPHAEIPVVQLAIDASKSPDFHYELGERLALLRERNVLLLGSGNVVHNLRMLGDIRGEYAWADRFDAYVRRSLENRDREALTNYEGHPDAAIAARESALRQLIGAYRLQVLAIFVTALCLNALGEYLRDVFAPNNAAGRDVNGDMKVDNSDLGWGSTYIATLNIALYLPSTADLSN